MSVRIQVVLENHEKAAYKKAAKMQGMSLSAWMKACARKGLEQHRKISLPGSRKELQAFFEECDQREQGVEPDWEEHKRIIERSVTSGISDS